MSVFLRGKKLFWVCLREEGGGGGRGRERDRDRQTERQRQTRDRQRETHTQTGRQKGRQRETDTHKDRQRKLQSLLCTKLESIVPLYIIYTRQRPGSLGNAISMRGLGTEKSPRR